MIALLLFWMIDARTMIDVKIDKSFVSRWVSESSARFRRGREKFMLMLIQTSYSHSDVLNISSNPLHVLQTSVSHIISPLISSGGAENNETRLNIEHCCSQFANFPPAPSLNIFEEPNIAAGQPLIGEWLPLAEHCASCIYIMSRYI